MAKTMLFNPYTGKPRDPRDIASDPDGKLMVDPDEPLRPAMTASVSMEPVAWVDTSDLLELKNVAAWNCTIYTILQHQHGGGVYDQTALHTAAQLQAARAEGRREGLEEAAKVARNACLAEPDGGYPSPDEVAVCNEAARRITALITKETP